MPQRKSPAADSRLARKLLNDAMALDRRGREAQAIEIYRRAIRMGLRGAALRDAMIGLGSSLRTVGRTRHAVSVLRKARKQFPRDKAVVLFLALASHDAGDKSAALRMLGLMVAQSSPGELSGYGRVLVRKFHGIKS